MLTVMWFSGLLIGFALARMAVRYQFKTGHWVKVGKATSWACQYPGKMPRLYGAKEIAEVNHDPDNGDRLFLMVEADAE